LYDPQIYGIELDLSEVLQAIRVIRNTPVPVNRLPPEILSKVFEYRTSEQDLVAATHVCRHWRFILISNPSLWSCFRLESSHDLGRTPTCLERSKSVPIDVNVNIDILRDPEVLAHFAPHIARTRSLIIHGSHGVHAASLHFCNPAPSLQHLEISSQKGISHLPGNFLGHQTPSLRSVTFRGVFPAFETFSPLPCLTEFYLYLSGGTDPLPMSALFRFLSDSPLLQKICITTPRRTTQDISLDQIISLDSLVALDYSQSSGSQVLPWLRLPRLKQLRVTCSLLWGQIQQLADILPYDGRALLAGATKMRYYSSRHLLWVDLFADDGLNVSLGAICITQNADQPSVDWFYDQTCIPFGQIEDLKVDGGSADAKFLANFFAFENLRVLRIALSNTRFIEGFLRLLHPVPGAGVPCRSLQEIACQGPLGPPLRLLISLAKERRQAGHQLGLVSLTNVRGVEQHSVEELREHVGEVRIGCPDTSIPDDWLLSHRLFF
jgi:hypothetical protein